jgi:hypothetical protein
MIDVKLPYGPTLRMYSSIKELPVQVSKKQQMYLVQAAGIGNSVADWDGKVARAIAYLENDKKDEAIIELKNIRLNVYSSIQGIDYNCLAFACMVAAEDDVPMTDYSEAALNAKLGQWSAAGLNMADVTDVLDDLKKNLIQSD